MGCLHDSDPALELVKSWIAQGAPLHDLSKCDEQQLACVEYIAPIFPERILASLENAFHSETFVSRSNPIFSTFIDLLRHIAYDSKLFERAVDLMLKFELTERQGENHNSVVSQIGQFFSLQLSGTLATPEQRQGLVRRLYFSKNKREREIGVNLLDEALNASHWSSSGRFKFGAQKRGYGWCPSNPQEQLSWYNGFIAILESGLASDDDEAVRISKSLLADHFRELWIQASCFEALENLIRQHGVGGSWPAVWMSIKCVQYYDKKHIKKLAELEKYTAPSAPSGPYSEIEAYVLANTWDHENLQEGYENEKKIQDKLTDLERLAAVKRSYINRLGDRVWEKQHIDSLIYFGMGLAGGSEDRRDTFEFLVSKLRSSNVEIPRVPLLYGYLRQVHNEDPSLFRRLVESTLNEEKLLEQFVYLLSLADIDPWGVEKLIKLAKQRAIHPRSFATISYCQNHKLISDEKLSELLSEILEMKDGFFVVFCILRRHFRLCKTSDYYPSEVILAVGRDAIEWFFAMHREESIANWHDLDTVSKFCLKADVPQDQVSKIVRLLCEGVETFRLPRRKLGRLIELLVSNFTILFLDEVFNGGDTEEMRALMIFPSSSNLLNRALVSEVIEWADNDQDRLEKLSKIIGAFSTVEVGNSELKHPKTVQLSEHVKALLDAATDKESVLQIIFKGAYSYSGVYSGSLADILETRAAAFEELLSYPSDSVRSSVSNKLDDFRQYIRRERDMEAQENKHEQRFE